MSAQNKSDKLVKFVTVPHAIEEIIPSFMRLTREDIQTMKTACTTNDFKKIMEVAHSLKGDCGGYGFFELGQIAGEIEAAAHEEKIDQLSRLVSAFDAYFQNINIRYE